MNLDDLIVLRFCENVCHVEAIGVKTAQKKAPTLRIDPEKNTWKIDDGLSNPLDAYPIGTARIFTHCNPQGPIGVYNRTRLEHVNEMVQTAHHYGCEGGKSSIDAD